MPKPIQFSYEKKAAFRDAFYLIIVCEGENREPDYFRFFDGMSSRVQIVAVENEDGKGAPHQLIEKALKKEEELGANADNGDRVWFIIDTDRWRALIHTLRDECNAHPNWQVAQSNPCFEVWLYFHAKDNLPELKHLNSCNSWKPHLPTVIKGGFNPDFHPIVIETAIINAKACYKANGYLPEPGSTQLWQLGEELIPVIKKELDILKHRFPAPELLQP
jgi:hypothetical protein